MWAEQVIDEYIVTWLQRIDLKARGSFYLACSKYDLIMSVTRNFAYGLTASISVNYNNNHLYNINTEGKISVPKDTLSINSLKQLDYLFNQILNLMIKEGYVDKND